MSQAFPIRKAPELVQMDRYAGSDFNCNIYAQAEHEQVTLKNHPELLKLVQDKRKEFEEKWRKNKV